MKKSESYGPGKRAYNRLDVISILEPELLPLLDLLLSSPLLISSLRELELSIRHAGCGSADSGRNLSQIYLDSACEFMCDTLKGVKVDCVKQCVS